jgi:hypothetical protein
VGHDTDAGIKTRGRTFPVVPVTLGNVRKHGVRSLAVACSICHREAVISAERWPDSVQVRTFSPRMVCTGCGIVGADARPPNWREHRAHGAG